MAKCTIEPKLDFDKFTEACERFKKICEREMGEACEETLPVILKKMEWIPTSLCLPEEGRPVLVTVKIWPDEHGYHYTTSIDVHDHNGWMDNGKNVVAWQPLPEPCKGE